VKNNRMLKAPVYDTREWIQPETLSKYYYTTIIFPNCCKQIINYFNNEEGMFRKIKDVENQASLLAIDYLKKKQINGKTTDLTTIESLYFPDLTKTVNPYIKPT
jgi:hypothetical protein